MENGPGGGVGAGRDQLGGGLGQGDPDLEEEATVKTGGQMDIDILEAEWTGLAGDLDDEKGGKKKVTRMTS